MWGLPSPGHQHPPQNNFNKIAIKQPQTRHRKRADTYKNLKKEHCMSNL